MWRYAYDPYGVSTPTKVDPTAPENPIQFAGEYRDSATGDYHLRARQYSPGTGRFMSPDPAAGPMADIATYLYADANPMVFSDPLGLFSIRGAVKGLNKVAKKVAAVAGVAAVVSLAVFPPAAPVLGAVAYYAGAVAAGTQIAIAYDTCRGGTKGSCRDAVVSAALWTATGALGRKAGPSFRRGSSSADDAVGATCVANSFAPATRVLMADGSSKPIAEVQVGDMVMAADPETGERGPRRVMDTIVGDGAKELVDIQIDEDVLTATDHHPFWVDDEGRWVHATELTRGDVLLLANGERTVVAAVRHRTEILRVHNLTVEGLHTYFVIAGDDPVLVHNCSGEKRPSVVPENPTTPPSWVKQGGHYAQTDDANPGGAAERILSEQYGPDGWSGKGAGSEFSKIQKWASRHFSWG